MSSKSPYTAAGVLSGKPEWLPVDAVTLDRALNDLVKERTAAERRIETAEKAQKDAQAHRHQVNDALAALLMAVPKDGRGGREAWIPEAEGFTRIQSYEVRGGHGVTVDSHPRVTRRDDLDFSALGPPDADTQPYDAGQDL